MSQQEIVCMIVLLQLTIYFLAIGGFEAIKRTMQSFGGIIRKITLRPIEKYKERKRIEQQWQQYIELHKNELISELMKTAHQEMAEKRYQTEDVEDALAELSAKAGIAVQDIDGREERTWKDKTMDRFMRQV